MRFQSIKGLVGSVCAYSKIVVQFFVWSRSVFHTTLTRKTVRSYFGEGIGMEENAWVTISQASCVHTKHKWYTQRRFDILNGYELELTRCINCHKTVEMKIKKLD